MTPDTNKKNYILILIFFLLGSWAYSNTLQAPFYFDDIQNIVDRSAIRLESLSLKNLIKAGQEGTVVSRPLANISFALNYYFHQFDVRGYHVVNIAIHILTSIFLFYLFFVLLSTSAINRDIPHKKLIAFFAALLWLVHPIQTQSVTYIVQRMNSMAAMFYIIAIICYASARLAAGKRSSILWFGGCFFAGLMAIASKEIAATLPFFLLLYEWYFLQDMSLVWLKRQKFYFAAIVLFLLFLTFFFLGQNPIENVLAGYKYKDYTLLQRLLTEPRVIFFYLGLFLLPLPSRFSLEHDILFSESLFSPPATLVSLIAIAGLLAASIILARKHRVLSFTLLWFWGNLIIESSFIPLELVFEHRMYLPSMFLCLLIALYCFRYLKTWMAVAVMVSLVLVGSGWTHARNAMWREPLLFHKSNVANAPNSYRAHYNYGLELYKEAQYGAAVQHFSKTLELEPRHLFANQDLGLAYTMAGDYENALKHFLEVLRVAPDHADTYVDIGYLYTRKDDTQNALLHYNKALQFEPGNADTHKRIGYLYASVEQFEKAIFHFQQALSLSKEYLFEMNNSLGIVFASIGKYDLAIDHFSKALSINPENKQIKYNLELARQKKLESE
jgi:tetratricopeptide (TPR) repeat protein